jgi:hypothetical protein
MMICTRCHGTLRGCPSWHALLRMGSSLHAWHAVSLRPERSGGFLWRWDHRLQRPSIRAGSSARHPMLSASFDDGWKAQRRRPHLYDGLRSRPGNATGRLHQHQGRSVIQHRNIAYASLSAAPSGKTPVSRNRQSAMSNLRATATIPMRLKRLPPPPKRSRNHTLRALSG